MLETSEDILTRAETKKVYRSEKEKKRQENKEYVPVFDAKQTVEVAVKSKPSIEQIETIEPKGKQKIMRKETKSKEEAIISKPSRTVEVEAKPKKIVELKGNSILIITEKPQAAMKIAAALSKGSARKYTENSTSYYEFNKNGENIIVACAVGHLFSLSQDVKGSNYPIFEVSWKPNFEVRKKDFTKKYYLLLSKLIKRAKEIIIATDYDVEGEVIGYNIIRFVANQKDAKRMKFSSLTASELENAFKQVHPSIDWGQAIAGETRHFIDWYYGINLSRALMSAVKTTGKFQIMSIGRVQGPALNMIVQREKEIQTFKSVPFWKIFIDVVSQENKKNKLRLRHVKDIFKEVELEKFRQLKGKIADVSTKKSHQSIPPPAPFDLTTLQTEVYKFFSINPAKTLQIAQELYLAGLISYPRTSSQKIPESINPKAILKKLAQHFPDVELASRNKPVEGKKSDPAHPSIYPTGEFNGIEGDAKKIYELIVKRFISCFCNNAEIESKTVTAVCEGLMFKERGIEILEEGWMKVYEARMNEKEIKDMNGKVDIINIEIEKAETQPPKRYSPASIISELEKHGLGTKATRANILETLYDRGYIRGEKSIEATPFGIDLINTLEKYSPIIIDEKLTRDLEKDMEGLQTAKKELDKKQDAILRKAKTSLNEIAEDFKKKEEKIGSELVRARKESWKKEAEESQIMQCPTCKKGILTIKYSPKFKRSFVACNKYPECKTTFSLPPYGFIKKLKEEKKCEKCGFPMLMSVQKGKKPWFFCFNPECSTRKE